MNKVYFLFIIFIYSFSANAQYKVQLTNKATIGVSTNIETYFFAEKLAVETIDNYVFDIKGVDYTHQPIVHFAFEHFKPFKNDPIIIRIAEILKQVRDTLGDNGPILDYLLNQKDFPDKGFRFTNSSRSGRKQPAGKLGTLLPELTDSLRRFYVKAAVSKFIADNRSFYEGALKEISKDISNTTYPAIEKWYGKRFPAYELYISSAMPITPGEDSYRGYGPAIWSPKGQIPAMIVSTSKMLKPQKSLKGYKEYGFDNQSVTQFLTVHEISHSFVNPPLETYAKKLKADSALFTPTLRDTLASRGIRDWNTCVTEHLVRVGEIRIAVSMGNAKEANRLRALHIGDYKCVLIPMLEEKVNEYEQNRKKYPNFEVYLPKLIDFLHQLTPQKIDEQFRRYNHYKPNSK
ncbi:hypothetical protein DHW03_02340 [Pedobacter yonginense]|uniref:DUF4932 domain-containing protein n=1 Tax=Pedobacter yonginense TaxID=651869 RepID=A0A317ETY2_9SPHI|nr:DUF4932 domain-containing protein [Pedobacter yonginense]PWS28706.1 hypothetical protein DHW03_02340 [Pedobacter yonginense]